MEPGDDRRSMAWSAAGIYLGAALITLLEGFVPGGQAFAALPGALAMALAVLVAAFGPRAPRPLLCTLGPLGATLVAYALAETSTPGDGAVLYLWPALWMAYFFSGRWTAFTVVWIAFVHAVALLSMPPGLASTDRWIDVTASVLVVSAVVRALSGRTERLMARLTAEAREDPLTGLHNRRGLLERAAVALARGERDGAPLGVVVFDIDHFKRVNDTLGHDQGDRVLAWLGEVLLQQARGADVVARTGGEEFVVLLPDATADEAGAFAERVREAVRAGSSRGAHGVAGAFGLTVSAGAASGAPPLDLQALLDAADRAMYLAKRAGRDRTVVLAREPSGAAA